MKFSTLLLVGSLAANAALVALFVKFAKDDHAPPVSPSTGNSPAAAPGASLVVSREGTAGNKSAGSADATTWTRLHTDDLRAFVARLRFAGFPPTVMRALVNERLREQFAERRKAIGGAAGEYEYWKPGGIYNSGFMADPKTRSALRDLTREQSVLAKELLGPDATPENDMSALFRNRQYGDLPREKAEQVGQVTQDYADLVSQVRAAANGLMLAEDRTKLAYLEEEKRKDLAALLTPAELADYEMRSSTTTSRLRFQLSSLDLTEDQFRTIYQIQKPFDEKYAPGGGGGGFVSAEMMTARREDQKKANEQIKAALGEALGTEYERAMDQNYQSASRVVTRLNLPKDTIQQVLDVQKDTEQRATAVRMDAKIPPDQKALQLAALAKEATDKLTGSLGARGLAAYKDNGGFWLGNLTPPPRP